MGWSLSLSSAWMGSILSGSSGGDQAAVGMIVLSWPCDGHYRSFFSFCAPAEPVVMSSPLSGLALLSYPSEGVQGSEMTVFNWLPPTRKTRDSWHLGNGPWGIHRSPLRSTYSSQGILYSYWPRKGSRICVRTQPLIWKYWEPLLILQRIKEQYFKPIGSFTMFVLGPHL